MRLRYGDGMVAAILAMSVAVSGCSEPDDASVVAVTHSPRERIVRLEAALEHDPKNTQNLAGLAEALVEMGDLPGAAARLDEAVRLDPDDPFLRRQLGLLLSDLGETERAIEQYRKALDLAASAEVHVLLANLLVAEGESDEAVTHYRDALVLDPEYVDAHYNLGVELGKRGKYSEAAAHYRAAVRVDGTHAEAANNLGAMLVLQGRVADSVPHFERAVRLAPRDVQARRNLAMALSGEGRIGEAVQVLEDGLARDPEAPELANYLAWLRATSSHGAWRNGKEAMRLAEVACKATNHRDANYLDTLAAAYAESGRFAEAVETARRAIALAAERPEQAAEFRSRLTLYEGGKPYREP